MNPILMNLVVCAKHDDIFQEARDQRVIKGWQTGMLRWPQQMATVSLALVIVVGLLILGLT